MSIDTQAIRDIVSCKSDQLAEMAAKHDVTNAGATVIRKHYTRRVTNRCVQCGRFLKEGNCEHCNLSTTPVIELLQEIQPQTILIRTKCKTCNGIISFQVGYILRVTQKYGFFNPPNNCSRCKAKKEKQEVKSKAQLEKKRSKKGVKLAVKKRTVVRNLSPPQPWYHKYMHSEEVFNRPFTALKSLKIEK